MENTFDKIKKVINSNNVVLFMKGTPDLPCCGFSSFVSGLLTKMKVNFIGINVLDDNSIREGIKKFSNWPTIPQLYIKGEFIGGCDIVKEMYHSGELQSTLIQHSIEYVD
jgi:monothiol glutaredoxin